ncbi:MFS transporter [Telmatospirillum siberiense]|uniref:Putative tartrate transporter n=1 Tax=Telmatospirillum siberiense TaxID=382514 RepID=A0A2N3PRU4_9PROT|nr:MFS transporter [Telmatospirillum siberiense]PKU23129.1 MFS transporter [Telmatospirillum siberiense]
MTATTVLEPENPVDLRKTYKKVALHLLPFLFICYLFNYLDRVNVGFAKLQMLDDLHLSETVYGLGAGIFFIGYVLCGVPSNLTLYKVGARRWLTVTMILWGIFSTCLLFVTSATSFYVLRLLTGASEAGFFPGIILYFTLWFPSAERGRIIALFMSAIPISGLIGSPFSGWILKSFASGMGGLAGWQWLYLLQGLPTILLGIGLFFLLNDGIDQAKWLNENERHALKQALIDDEKNRPATVSDSFARVLRNPSVWVLGIIYFCIQCGVYSINFWLPTIIKSSGIANPMTIGWLSAIPYLAASIFMVIVGRSADAKRERRWHLAVPMLMGVVGLLIAANFASSTTVATIGLTLATMGALTGLPMFWPLSGGFLTASAAAGGLALINSLGQCAGFLSPYLVGWIKDTTHSTDLALYILAALMLLGVVLVLRIPGRVVNR